MKLMELVGDDQLPYPTAEILALPVFKTLWSTVMKIDGDRDGRKKTRNLQIFGYMYFWSAYDSRFRYKKQEEKDKAIRKLLGLSDDFVISDEMQQGIHILNEMNISESQETVDEFETTIVAVKSWLKNRRNIIAGGGMPAKEISEVMDIADRLPKTIENIRKAKEQLNQDLQAKLIVGRKGRQPNKFELENPLYKNSV